MRIIWHVQTGRTAAQVTAADVRQHRLSARHRTRIARVLLLLLVGKGHWQRFTALVVQVRVVLVPATALLPALLLTPPVGGPAAAAAAVMMVGLVVQLLVLCGSLL